MKSNNKNSSLAEITELKNPFSIPSSINDFKEWHYKALRRLHKHPVNIKFYGLLTVEVNIDAFTSIAINLELIRFSTYNESLHLMKNDILKTILKENGLKVAGNKSELIHRILEYIPEDVVRNSSTYSDTYLLTTKGHEIIEQSYSKFEAAHIDFFKRTINLIMEGKYDDAYRLICKRNAEMPIPPGTNCDWTALYHNGLGTKRRNIYQQILSSSNDRVITAASIYSQMSGDTLKTVHFYLYHLFHMDYDILDTLRSEINKLSSKINFKTYNYAGIKKYKYLAVLDLNTCPQCRKLDGKIFSVRERKIGINCPPMHDGCRCTTIADMPDEFVNNLKRAARDPVTGKSIVVPMSMTYYEWYKKYVTE